MCYLHSSWQKVLPTTDVHGQCINQIHTTGELLPAWYWDCHWPSMPNCQGDYSCWECIYWVQGDVRQHQGGPDSRQCISQFQGAFCPSVLVQHRQWHSWRMVSTPVLRGTRNWEEKSISHILQCSCHPVNFFCLNLHSLCIKNLLKGHFNKLFG